MAGQWEPVGQPRQWEPVGRKDLDEGLGELGQNVLGAAEAVGTALPRFLAAGPSIAGHGIAGAIQGRSAEQIFGEDMPEGLSRTFTEGFITPKGKEAMEALMHYAGEIPREASGSVASFLGSLPGRMASPQYKPQPGESDALSRGIGETGFDVVMTLLGARAGGRKGPKPYTPEEQAFLKKRQEQQRPPEEPIRSGPQGEQMDLPGMERPMLETPEQTSARIAGDEPIRRGPEGEQLRLWEPVGEERRPIPITPEDALLAEPGTDIPSLKGDRLPGEGRFGEGGVDVQSQRPQFPLDITDPSVIDFPFRQEALERDPHIYKLRQQYRTALTKGLEQRAKSILMDAEIYVENQYNISATLGPLFSSDRGTALPITNKAPIEPGMTGGRAKQYKTTPSPSNIIQKVKNFRQRGSFDPEVFQEGVAKFANAIKIPVGHFLNPRLAAIQMKSLADPPRYDYISRNSLEVIQESSRSPFFKEVAKMLLSDKDFNPGFRLEQRESMRKRSNLENEPVGQYLPPEHLIAIREGYAGHEALFIHEAIHARSFAALEALKTTTPYSYNKKIHEFSHPARHYAQRVTELFNKLKNDSEFKIKNMTDLEILSPEYISRLEEIGNQYGIKNPHEFIAEGFSNPEFQALLKQIPLPKELQRRGIKFYWDAFVQTLSDLLGLRNSKKNETYMSALLEAGAGMMQEMNRSDRMAYASSEVPKLHGERGSIGFPRDPKFEAFKDSLPEAMKGRAKLLYSEWQKMQKGGPPEVISNERALTATKSIPGMKDIFSEVASIEKSVEELKPTILTESDLGSSKLAQMGRQLVSGIKILGFGSQNTVVRLGGQVIDNALKRAEKFNRDEVVKKDAGLKARWEKLTSKEQDSLWPVMIAAEGKEVLSKERLLELGMSDKQIAAYQKSREVLDKVLGRVNSARELIGKKPIPARQGYIMSRFLGDFKVDVFDIEGKRVHSIGDSTKWGAKRARELLKTQYPEYTYSEVRHEPIHRIGSTDSVTQGYQALLHMLDESDPRVAALESTMQEWNNSKGFDALGYKRHFIPKSEVPVKGFEGAKEWKSQRQNTKEGLHATMVYVDQAMRWAELQEANQTIKQILSDKEITNQHPNATQFVKNYFDQVSGRSVGLTRAIDTMADFVAEHSGIGNSLQTRILRETKQFFTSLYLGGWNLAFSASQILQPPQMLPPWFHYLHQRGARHIGDAMAGGMQDAVWYGFSEKKMTPFGREAMKYADDFGITDAHFLDDVRSLNESKGHRFYTTLTTMSMTAPEKVARRMTYLMFAHLLKANDIPMGKKLFETASNLTEMSMVDYRLHERANVYKALGIVGESASALTTFKHNYYSQMWALSKRGGSPVLMNMIGMSMLFGGLMGFYGREEIDALINLINKASPTRIPTMTEMLLKAPDLVTFGGLSAATGLDMSPKFSMSNVVPDDLGKALFPFGGTIADVAESVAGLVANPSKSQAVRLAQPLSPAPLKPLTEGYFSNESRTVNPKTLEGKYDRTPFDWKARFGGLRSTKESREVQENYQKKRSDEFYIEKRNSILQKAKDRYFEKNGMSTPEWRTFAKKYVENEGDVDDLVDRIIQNVASRHQSEARRTLLESLENPVRYKRLKEMTSGK